MGLLSINEGITLLPNSITLQEKLGDVTLEEQLSILQRLRQNPILTSYTFDSS